MPSSSTNTNTKAMIHKVIASKVAKTSSKASHCRQQKAESIRPISKRSSAAAAATADPSPQRPPVTTAGQSRRKRDAEGESEKQAAKKQKRLRAAAPKVPSPPPVVEEVQVPLSAATRRKMKQLAVKERRRLEDLARELKYDKGRSSHELLPKVVLTFPEQMRRKEASRKQQAKREERRKVRAKEKEDKKKADKAARAAKREKLKVKRG